MMGAAAFGIAQAQQKKHEAAWKDLGLHDLVNSTPRDGIARKLPR